jgi:hypothetical protein
VPITFTANVHVALAAKVAPDSATLFEPAAAVIVPLPQVPVSPLGVATVSPAGKVSVKPMPLKEVAVLGFDRLKVSEVAPFNETLAAPKTFAIVGGKVAGGGLPEPDEPPPPQAVFPSKLNAMPRNSNTEHTLLQNIGEVF